MRKELNTLIHLIILVQAILFIISSLIGWLGYGENDKWFLRWVFGMILLALYVIMSHLEKGLIK